MKLVIGIILICSLPTFAGGPKPLSPEPSFVPKGEVDTSFNGTGYLKLFNENDFKQLISNQGIEYEGPSTNIELPISLSGASDYILSTYLKRLEYNGQETNYSFNLQKITPSGQVLAKKPIQSGDPRDPGNFFGFDIVGKKFWTEGQVVTAPNTEGYNGLRKYLGTLPENSNVVGQKLLNNDSVNSGNFSIQLDAANQLALIYAGNTEWRQETSMTTSPVVFKTDTNGVPDASFGINGMLTFDIKTQANIQQYNIGSLAAYKRKYYALLQKLENIGINNNGDRFSKITGMEFVQFDSKGTSVIRKPFNIADICVASTKSGGVELFNPVNDVVNELNAKLVNLNPALTSEDSWDTWAIKCVVDRTLSLGKDSEGNEGFQTYSMTTFSFYSLKDQKLLGPTYITHVPECPKSFFDPHGNILHLKRGNFTTVTRFKPGAGLDKTFGVNGVFTVPPQYDAIGPGVWFDYTSIETDYQGKYLLKGNYVVDKKFGDGSVNTFYNPVIVRIK